MNDPHVVIAGAGALGSLVGGLLAEGGLHVTLVARSPEHVSAIRAGGLRIVGAGGDRSVPVAASTDLDAAAEADLVIVLCKAPATRALCACLAPVMKRGAAALSLQNGLGNEETIEDALGAGAVLGGLTALGARLEAPGVVRNFAALPTLIGEMSGGLSRRAERLAALLSAHGLPTRPSADIVAEKWRKLMLNVAMSATSGLTGLSIGEVARRPALAEVARRAMEETAAVAQACGVALAAEDRFALFEAIVASPAAGNVTSMRRDIEARRVSEVEAIYRSVIERGRARGVPTPTLGTLAALVEGVEAASGAR